jgi:hypothetical protein
MTVGDLAKETGGLRRLSVMTAGTARKGDVSGDYPKAKRNPKPSTGASIAPNPRRRNGLSESAPCWTRTNNLLIKSQLLCQLS